ncbi:hypothetical protein BT93_B2478 [Corymbia citriodora subsp. variegata]|nr:hypothetical protein BT93_B2478 [Corymbia citriodora subsp. variegata]
MERHSAQMTAFVLVISLFRVAHGWGIEGHYTICKIAQSRLTGAAADAVKQLLPKSAEDLASVCAWADRVKFRYRWSSELHFLNTPDDLCNYQYNRDCKDDNGEKGRCVAGAINNYTTQLLGYESKSLRAAYNLTEALMFLSHFMGDIHQPLHVGFTTDKGANTIDVHWYTRKQNLHHVWDSNIIETAEDRYYSSDIDELVDAIQQNITTEWADQIKDWENCNSTKPPCPNIYASESITAACQWAYKGVSNGSVLEDPYFLSRLPTIHLRLAKGGVRLAATLNRIFK